MEESGLLCTRAHSSLTLAFGFVAGQTPYGRRGSLPGISAVTRGRRESRVSRGRFWDERGLLAYERQLAGGYQYREGRKVRDDLPGGCRAGSEP